MSGTLLHPLNEVRGSLPVPGINLELLGRCVQMPWRLAVMKVWQEGMTRR